jgi:RNA polymerase sigma factor (sigma-70 family)
VQDEPDRELLRRFTHGDREAFEALFRQFEREVYRWILRIVRESSAAEDALIEAFWRAYRGHARFDASRSFGAWMRRIATNVAIDQLNAARRRKWSSLDTAGQDPPEREPDLPIRIYRITSGVHLRLCRRSCASSQRWRSSKSCRSRRSPTRWMSRLAR